jgi:rare lipoprotein A
MRWPCINSAGKSLWSYSLTISNERLKTLAAFFLFAMLASCGSNEVTDSAPSGSVGRLPDDAIPRPEPKGRYGNGPVYEVFDVSYTVMDSANGYRERGVASWYGKKFHGELTSSREVYNMYAMTAAHKTLPLPTYVQVRNLSNNKTVVVRVNDRGPFVDNRIIDLSYSAALKLDMVHNGTGLVEVTAINFDEPKRDKGTGDKSDRPASQTTAAAAPAAEAASQVFIQVGAFGSIDNASRRYSTLKNNGISGAAIHEDKSSSPPIYRVRIGPIDGVAQYDEIAGQLAGLGINDPILVTQ